MTENNSNASLNSNSLLAYKLLGDSWDVEPDGNVFKEMMKEEMKTLASSIALIQSDPVLALNYGNNLNGAEKVSEILKTKMNELEIRNRIEPTAQMLLAHKYRGGPLEALMPGQKDAVGIDKATGKLQIQKGSMLDAESKNGVTNKFNTWSSASRKAYGIIS